MDDVFCRWTSSGITSLAHFTSPPIRVWSWVTVRLRGGTTGDGDEDGLGI